MDFIEKSILLETHDITCTDHRAFLININLESYFEDDMSSWDQINRCQLNPARRLHRNKFIELLEEQLDITNIKNELF